MADSEIIFFGNELPKGDIQDTFRKLHLRSKDANHPLLARFISEATQALRDEVSELPSDIRQQIPAFDSLLQWVNMTDLREGSLSGAVEGIILVAAQVGVYIGFVEENLQSLRNFNATSIAGLGIGLLASTAAALSSQPCDLPLAGADAVALAFRLGVHVQAVSENLETRDPSSKPETWAYVVHDVDAGQAQTELDTAHARDNVPETGKIFISATDPTAITISGPPTQLKTIFHKIPFFRDARSVPLPVYGGLCHAPHIYHDNDVLSILATPTGPLRAASSNMQPVMAVCCTSTGQKYPAQTATELYASVLRELLTCPISWHEVVKALQISASASKNVNIHCFGNSLPLSDLKSALTANHRDADTSLNNLCTWLDEASPNAIRPSGPKQDKLAIVGMACRLPGGATTTEKFWEILEQGLDVSRQIPADRFDIATHYDPTGKQMNKTMTQYGCFIDDPGLFDAPFFSMSPKEAQVTDPQMRLSLVTAYEALERAGYVGNRTFSTKLERIGTYYGQAADDYREVNQGQEVSTYYIPGGCRAFGPGRINYFFKFAGPSYSIDTACSSGLAAIEVACQALWAGDVDTAVAGGVNVLTNPDGFSGLCNGHFLTKGHNACKTWDASADGYCRADAVGTVVIKRLQDAEADNDNILGVILGAGTNHSATAVSITHPHAGHQAYLARQVLGRAGVDPLDVSYAELHGTGTQAGDHHEMAGILDVYAPPTRRRGKNQPLHIGASKANVGHSESAAGTTALLKVLLMLQKNAIPRHIGIKTTINPEFPDLLKKNVHIPFVMEPWTSKPGQKRLAAINNFGAAGGNTTMILEEAPARRRSAEDPRKTHVVAVSAKSKVSLRGNLERLIAYLDQHTDVSMADLAYTTTARRYQHTHRYAFTTTDRTHLKKQLTSALDTCESISPVGKSGVPSVAFTFTGQGAAHKSMNLELYRDSSVFRQQIQHFDALARSQGLPSFVAAVDGTHPNDYLHSPTVTQLALVCTEMALANYWSSLGVKPDLVVGHSLGEYAAMYVAGVTTASDTIHMVGRRAQMLEQTCQSGSHTMMAVRASLEQIKQCLQGAPFAVACVNGPSETVLSGTKEQVGQVAGPLRAAGYRCIELDVAFAFHSEQTDPILDDFEALTKASVRFQEPRLPYISPLLGKVVFDGKTLSANYVRRATREPVDFLAGIRNAEEIGTIDQNTVWLEIGPHPVCTNFVKATLPGTRLALPSMRRDDDNWKTIAEGMAALHLVGVPVDWNEFHRPFESMLRLLDLPTYAFNEKNYWLQYNGDWCLTKGNTYYSSSGTPEKHKAVTPSSHEIQTSTIQQVLEESFDEFYGKIVVQSDLMQPDFLAAANGHRMNDCGVVTSSIHADIAFTLGGYLLRKLRPKSKTPNINVANLVVTKGLVARKTQGQAQLIQITASTANIDDGVAELTWQNVDNNGNTSEPFATANIIYDSAEQWLSSWSPLSHFVHGRIADLAALATSGAASRFSRSMAYTLFASNLVDYADKYRGMQTVIMHNLEAYAEVQLTTHESGHWTVPPYFIDSVAHLAGFVMNCSDAMDTKGNYCVTPGWNSMRFAEPLVAGQHYRSYVKMIPSQQDPSVYFGDVYIMRGDESQEIIGMVGGIQFRKYPRILLNRFFSPPEGSTESAGSTRSTALVSSTSIRPVHKPVAPAPQSDFIPLPMNAPHMNPGPKTQKSAPSTSPQPQKQSKVNTVDSTSAKALKLVADEAGLEPQDLDDDANFADLGVDSLMSLVIAEKLRTDLGVKVGGSLFLDYPTIGDMRTWLDEAYS